MIRALLISLGFLCAARTTVAAQYSGAHARAGDRWYQQMAYALAANEYQLAADQGAVNEHVSARLAECYMRTGQMEKAEHWYGVVVKFLDRSPEDLYNYALALKANGNYNKAEEWMDKYLATIYRDGSTPRSNLSELAQKFALDEDRFTIRNCAINTPGSDFGTSWMGPSQICFASTRGSSSAVVRVAAWNDQPFLDLFLVDRLPEGDLVDPRPLQGKVNSKWHEGPAACTSDQGTLIFTRNVYLKGRAHRSTERILHVGLYSARLRSGGWTEVAPFKLNSTETNIGHPALSPDGNTLYFISDMPGGEGGADVYRCRRQGDTWGEPENLGPSVNTPRREGFPFVAENGTLYFASDGLLGLGGLDIFAAEALPDGSFAQAVNVGAPVNGPRDDFAFLLHRDGRTGYFSSNRPGGQGDDDIYSFTMHRPLTQRFLVSGLVSDADDELPLVQVEVQLLDSAGAVLAATLTDVRGRYAFSLERDKEYMVASQIPGHYRRVLHLNTAEISREQIIIRDLQLLPDAGVYLNGTVRRHGGPGFMQDVTVSVVNVSTFFTETQKTDQGGDFLFRLAPNEEFEVLLERAGYWSISVPISTQGVRQGVVDLGTAAELTMEPITSGTPIRLKHIRWAQGSAQLDPMARLELDRLADRLLVNPLVRVELSVHSDARGEAARELELSEKRAQSIAAYLKGKGIGADRLVAKGYGMLRPVNSCSAATSCTEQQHAENRRVEYLVTALGED
jgi:outer membrane protein OmpA-like peptidoglycan-associated protein